MIWSLEGFPINRRADDALHALGRALYIATGFENTCKFILRIARLEEAVQADPVLKLEELIARLPGDNLLFGTLRDLVRIGPVDHAEELILTAAREARNAIAHEHAHFDIREDRLGPSLRDAIERKTIPFDVGQLRDRLRRLRADVRDLAAGDNLVSTWSFDIQEGRKTDRPQAFIDGYEEQVERWVLGPVWDLLDGLT